MKKRKYELVCWNWNLVSFKYNNDFEYELNNGDCESLGFFSKNCIVNLIKNNEYDFCDSTVPDEIYNCLKEEEKMKCLNYDFSQEKEEFKSQSQKQGGQ